MVSVRNILAAVVAIAIPAIVQATPAQIVQKLKQMTEKTQTLQGPATSLDLVNGPLIAVGEGPFPIILQGYGIIAETAHAVVSQQNGMTPVPAGTQSDAIFKAFSDFTRVSQVLLETLIEKSDYYRGIYFISDPVTTTLREFEFAVESLEGFLNDNVPSHATSIQSKAASLLKILEAALEAYAPIV